MGNAGANSLNDPPLENFNVAIVGAGIGGLALAIALHKKEIPFTIYEEAKQYSAVGAGIGFGPNGLQAMEMIEKDFRPRYEAICVGNKSADAQHVFFEGLLLEEGLGLHERWNGHSSWGHPDYIRKSAHRKDLLDIMTSFIPTKKIAFDKRLIIIQQDSGKCTLTFADGSVVEASVIVGADGIQSIVRDHVLKPCCPSEVDPVYANSYCYRGVIPIAEANKILGDLTDVAKIYMGNKRSCVTYRISRGAEFNFLLCVSDDRPWPSKDGVTQKVSHGEMMNDFTDRGVDARFIKLLEKAQSIRWGLFHHRHTSTYYRNRAVLLGDSAHASLPFQAAGASQGLEDAVVLSEVLSRVAGESQQTLDLNSSIAAAFEGYDAVRRPRAQRQLEQSEEVSDMIYFQHAELGSDMTKILPRLQQGRFDWLWFHDLTEDVKMARERMEERLSQESRSQVLVSR